MNDSPNLLRIAAVVLLFGAAMFMPIRSPRQVQAATIPPPASPTWSHEIAPIVYGHCVTCHHPGGAGPFSLLTYEDAKRWGPQVEKVTQSRFMPPWLPEPGHGDFADVRRLPDHDLALIHRWIAAGMPAGDLKTAPPQPAYDSAWQLGKPDLVLKVSQPFTLPAGGSDVFRNFILPYPLRDSHFIRAMEIRPGAPQVVHHANVLIDRTGSLRHQHAGDWQTGFPGMEILLDAGNTFDPDSNFLFWKPDTPALVEPEGMPWRLDPGNDLVVNVHLKPSGKQETIDVEIGLYFTDKPPDKFPMLLQLDRDDALNIPPGDPHFQVEEEFTLPISVEALGVYPHAHYLGKEMQVWATLPDGKKEWLVWIRDWDIDRQAVYRYRQPVKLPRGTVLHMRYVYDNSPANPRNPHTPPVRVLAGNRSEDEMAHLWLQVLPAPVPTGGPDPRLQLEEAWMRTRLRRTPGDRVSEYNLGAALTGEGKFTEAIQTFEQDLAADPGDLRVSNALGAAQEGAGDWQKARATFRQAADSSSHSPAADASRCDARFNLAQLELQHELFPEAERDLRAHHEACPEDAEVHAGLGAALAAEGRHDPAQTEFLRALAIDPSNFSALLSLGEEALKSGDLVQATNRLEAAVARNAASADAHERLAQAYGGSNRLDDAIAQLRVAIKLSPNLAELHALLSQALDAANQATAAIDEAQAVVRLNPQAADGWNNLGVLEVRSDRRDSARHDFERALQLDPNHAQAKANLERLGPSAQSR